MNRQRQSGFTLLELLAALLVMAVCSSVVLVALGQSVHTLRRVKYSDRLSFATRSLFDDLDSRTLQVGRTEGVLDGDIHWTLLVSEQAGQRGKPRLMRLDVTISEGNRYAEFSTLRLVNSAETRALEKAL